MRKHRYYVFSYSTYYPQGGMDDCALMTRDRKFAIFMAVKLRDDGYHAFVWDVKKEKYVELPEE